ncbi:hypothetical protein O181_042565 [Austropuccinia psidii MF-1]|uniref:Uncharacterized protein n=1 Tax=Austropuccinia psidii MF-1 TaxID=1389203 RepID=A0A9Q3DKW4_9BASI|nr:hypothetical protein [Austropuccinia psidii MF-1]
MYSFILLSINCLLPGKRKAVQEIVPQIVRKKVTIEQQPQKFDLSYLVQVSPLNIRGSSSTDRRLIDLNARPPLGDSSDGDEAEYFHFHPVRSVSNLIRPTVPPATRKIQRIAEAPKLWGIPIFLLQTFKMDVRDFTQILFPEEAKICKPTGFTGTWIELEKIMQMLPLQRDFQKYFVMETEDGFRFPHIPMLKRKEATSSRRAVIYAANCVAGELLFQDLGLEDKKIELIRDLGQKWSVEAPIGSKSQKIFPIMVEALDYGTKSLLIKISRLNQVISEPPFKTKIELEEAQRSALEFFHEIWRNSSPLEMNQMIEGRVTTSRSDLVALFTSFFKNYKRRVDLVTFGNVVFETWLKNHLPDIRDKIIKQNRLKYKIKEAINDIAILEAIASFDGVLLREVFIGMCL